MSDVSSRGSFGCEFALCLYKTCCMHCIVSSFLLEPNPKSCSGVPFRLLFLWGKQRRSSSELSLGMDSVCLRLASGMNFSVGKDTVWTCGPETIMHINPLCLLLCTSLLDTVNARNSLEFLKGIYFRLCKCELKCILKMNLTI